MKEQVFRKSSIDRVNSPEQLNSYIRVANPSVWLVLSAVIVLLLGACVWGIFGRIETTVSIPVVAKGGIVTGYFAAGENAGIETGMAVAVGDMKGTVASLSGAPVQMGEGIEPYVFYLGNFSQGDFCYQAQISIDGLSDGVYEAKVVVDSVVPISFVIR